MAMMDFIFWPFAFAFTGAMMIVWLVILAFWIWMIIDCAQRHFKNNTEKIIWILVIILTIHIFAIGAIIYYFIVKSKNKH